MANKVEIKNKVREQVIGIFGIKNNDKFVQVDSGSFIIELEDYANGKNYVEVKFIVKNDEYNLEEAKNIYAEKVKKAIEREADKVRKAAEREAKSKK